MDLNLIYADVLENELLVNIPMSFFGYWSSGSTSPYII